MVIDPWIGGKRGRVVIIFMRKRIRNLNQAIEVDDRNHVIEV